MRPVRGRPSRSNASDDVWRNGKATAMVIGGPIVATDAVCAPAVVSAISLCTGPTIGKGGCGCNELCWSKGVICAMSSEDAVQPALSDCTRRIPCIQYG